jgi:integrase
MRGAVYKRGSTWTWHFDVDPDPLTGRRRQRTKGGYKTKRAAEQALGEAIERWRAGQLPQRSTHTLGHFLEHEWLPAVRPRLRASTWANYHTYTTAYVLPVLGGVKLQALTPVQLNSFYALLLERGRRRATRRGTAGLAPKTVRNVHVMLHRALRDAMRWGYLVRNVAEAADPPAARSPEQRVWSPAQLGAFLAHVRGDRLYALWLLVATTGMRRGELAGLRWADVDLDHATVTPLVPRVVVDHQVHASAPKTELGRRRLALDPVTLGVLRDHFARQAQDRATVGPRYQDHGYVFTWPDGRALHPDNITGWFEQHTRAAGLPRIRLHDVRHSYATAALAAGVPAKVVSERLGHASVAFTLQVYGHVIPGMDADAAATVADLILNSAQKRSGTVVPGPSANNAANNGPLGHSQMKEVKDVRPAQ